MHPRIAEATDQWIGRPVGATPPRFQLFRVPYAGGVTGLVRDWTVKLRPDVEIRALRLPRREGRFCEPALRRWDLVVESLIPNLTGWLDLHLGTFGHRLGSLHGFV